MTTKKALREKLLDYRKSLPEARFQHLSAEIMRRLSRLPEIRRARAIHCYWPIVEKRELDTRKLITEWHAAGKKVVLPVIRSFGDITERSDRMEHWIFKGETNLVTNRWGVREPSEKDPFPVSELDVVVVPALGADRNGIRLGYGKGFYDEFLSRCNCPFVCPVLSSGLLEDIPAMQHDIPVDIIVTEREVIRIKP